MTVPQLREIHTNLGGGTRRRKAEYVEAILARQGAPLPPTILTPLSNAVRRYDVAAVRNLLLTKQDLSPNDINEAWVAAAHKDDGTMARLIYEAGVPNVAYLNNEAFRWLAYRGNVDLIRQLLQDPGVDPTANNNEAWQDVNKTDAPQLLTAYAQIKALLAADPRVQQSLGLEPTYTNLVELQQRLLRPLTEPPRANLIPGATTEDFFFEPEKFAQYIQRHIMPNPGGQAINMPDWFLTSEDMATFQQVMRLIGYGDVQGSFDDLFQLLLWTYYLDAPIKITPELAQEIAATTIEQQLSLLTPSYTGPTDIAGRFFVLYTVRHPPAYDWSKPGVLDRYNQVSQYSPLIVYRLAEYLYGYDGKATLLSPYRFIATKPTSPLDPYIIQYNNRPDDMAQYIGMVFPPGATDKESYYFTHLSSYSDVVASPLRQQGLLQPPPLLKDMQPLTIRNVIAPYTDAELMDAYEITPFPGMTRQTLIQKIADEATETGARWHFRKRSCANDTQELRNINIVTGEPRAKNDPTDPILSYGTLYDYHCYNLSELLGSFDFDNPELKDTFRFKRPDYIKGDLTSEFSDVSIRQLQTLLQGMLNPIWQPLLDKIRLGFEFKAEMGRMLAQRSREFNAMPDTDKPLVRQYLSWLFTLGMTMRFWKGPGFPYPHVWVEGGGGAERCETATRDVNVNNKFIERLSLLGKMPRPLEAWVLSLPRVKYNFQTQQATVGKETIDYVIQEAQKGEFCMADASDRITQTAYFLATRILGLDNTGFNAMLNEYFNPPVPLGTAPRPIINQPPFQPETVGVTGHTDPWHRLEELPEVQPQRVPTQPRRAPTQPGLPIGIDAAEILRRVPTQPGLQRAPTQRRQARQLTQAPVGGRGEAGGLHLGELEQAGINTTAVVPVQPRDARDVPRGRREFRRNLTQEFDTVMDEVD